MTQTERDLKSELDSLDEQTASPVESWPENVFSQGTTDAVKSLGVEDAIARATQEQEAARKAEQEQSVVDNAREAVRIDANNAAAQDQHQRGVFGDSFGVLTPEESKTAAQGEYDWSKWLANRTAKGAEFFNQPSQSMLDSVLKYNPVGLIQGATLRGFDASQQKRFTAAKDMMEGRAPMPELTPMRAFIENTVRGAADAFVVDTIQSLGIARGYATKLSGGKYLEQADQIKVDPSDDPLYKIGLNVEEFVKKQFPGDAARQQQFAQQLAQGVGSTAGFAGSGWLGKIAGLGERGVLALIGLTGAASQSAQTFKEVTAALKKGDATETDRTINMLAAIALGATEAAPFAPTIGPGLKLGARAASAVEQAMEESLQEGVQQFGQNLVTQQTYDPNQTLMEGVPEGVAIGGLTGGAFGGLTGEHANVAAQAGGDKPVQEAKLRTPNTAAGAGPADTRPVAPMMEGPAQKGAPSTRAEPDVFSEPDLEAARKAIQQAAQGLPLDQVAEPAPVEEAPTESTAEPVEAEPGDTNTQIANEVSNFLDIPEENRAGVEDAVRAVDQMVNDDQLDLPAVFADIEQYLAENEIDTQLSDDDVKAIARSLYEGKDLGAAVDRALGIENAKPEAVAEPDGPSDDTRQKFAEVLASSTPRSQWAEAAGVDPDTLNSLINEAVSDGRMEIRFGKPVRKATARVAPVKPERPAAPASAPAMLRSEEKRLEGVKSDKAYSTTADLFNARGTPGSFQAALDRIYADKSIKNADLAQITKAFTGKRAKPKNRQDAINKLSQAHTAWAARNKGKGTNANRADVGQGPGPVSEGSVPQAVRQNAEGRDTGGSPESSGTGRAGDVGGLESVNDDVAGSPDRVRGQGQETGTDTGNRAGTGEPRSGTSAVVEPEPVKPRERTPEEIAALQADLAAEQEELEAQRRDRLARNYRITEADRIGQGGPKQKVRANIAAIETLKKIEEENRPATDEEKAILVKYVGWGAFSQPIFKDYNREFDKERNAIKALLTPEEYTSAKDSTINAHFTSPEVIKGMWAALDHLGFKGGRVLEPSVGVGHFIGLQPEAMAGNSSWTAVDLDTLSGRITQALYGAADVRIGGYEDQVWPNDHFDLAVSNVPFFDTGPYDPAYKQKFTLHDYFFVKSLDKVRPGGLVAFITSAGTLDKVRDQARREMEKRGTFLGAIRLPGGNKGAFKANAGTDVTTDIIFFRKRMQGEPIDTNAEWTTLETVKTPEGDTDINGYFVKNPDMMLGKMRLIGSMYGKGEPVLIGPTEDMEQRITEAAKKLPENAMVDRSTVVAPLDEVDTATDGIKEGAFYQKDGKIYRKVVGVGVPQKLNKTDAARVQSFIPLRDTINEMLAKQARGDKTGMDEMRSALSAGYDSFVKQFGPINLTNISTQTQKNGKVRTVRRMPNFSPLEDDADAYKVAAIEAYDPKTGKATKTAIFTEDLLKPYERPAITGPADALTVSLNEAGRVDMKLIADVLGVSEKRAAQELGDAVFLNPAGEQWQTAAQYLSGDVVTKLADAQTAADLDQKYQRNVTALEAVQPIPLTRNEITIPFGASYIPEDVLNAFLNETLGTSGVQVSLNPATKSWSVRFTGGLSDASRAEWGTKDKKVGEIVESALNSKPITVWRDVDKETRVRDLEAEELARAKVTMLKEAFTGQIYPGAQAAVGGWVWNDEARATRLEALYNQAMNRLVKEQHDGSHLTFPGLARVISFPDGTTGKINLPPARTGAIWRIIQNGNTLIDHVVGAGKTWTSIMAVMEMKRLGQIRRPMFVVPNHMLMQFSSEFLQAYPGAKLLVATKDNMSRAKRAEFAAKAAAEKWDGIIITHSAFSRLKMQEAAYKDYYEEILSQLSSAEKGEDGATVKDIVKAKKRIKTKLDNLIKKENKDQGITFEELGVDHITVDEAHLFKNLWFMTRHTRVKGISNSSESQRATDLYIKIRHLEKSRPGRSALFLTGTPLSNTMAEVYTMMRYLMGPTLDEYGIREFDSWAQTFGMIDTKTELSSNSKDYTDITSFSKFVNIPELSALYGKIADTQTAESLGLERPKIKGGMPQVINSEPSEQEASLLDAIREKMESLKGGKPEKGAPNFLSMFTKGLLASTDARLVDPSASYNPDGKIGKAVANIFKIWEEGNKDPAAPNKAQAVFLDMGVPGSRASGKPLDLTKDETEALLDPLEAVRQGLADTGTDEASEETDDGEEIQPEKNEEESAVEKMFYGKFNLYEDIKNRLIEKGVPADQIAFIHDAKNDDQKAKLFEAVREGKVRVLIGSTGKMGVGTNVQKRLIALHHIDAPWRPSDLEQRDGRILRQGNKNPEIQIYRYITKKSFEAYRWQILERKASFIAQFRAGARGLRIAEDIDSPLPDAAEIKAAATGDSRIVEYAELDRTVRGLIAQASAHSGVAVRARQALGQVKSTITSISKRIGTLERDAAKVTDLRGDAFKISVNLPGEKTQEITERKKAGQALGRYIAALAQNAYYGREIDIEFGTISGFEVSGTVRKGPDGIEVRPEVKGEDTYRARSSFFFTEETNPVSMIQAYERLVASVPDLLAESKANLAAEQAQIPGLEAKTAATPFPKQAELEEKQKKLAELAQALKPKKVDPNAVPVLKVGEPLVVSNMPVATWQKMKLDLKMGQPFSTVEGMLELAAVAHEKLTQICQSIAEKLGVKFRSAPLKKQTRIVEKLNGRDPRNITDVARGGFDVESVAVSDEVVNALAEALRVVDEGWSVTPGGYFDRKVMVVFDNDVVGEIQMWPPGMYEAKNNGGHKLYEEARRPSTADEDRARLEAQMRELYTEVVRHMPEDFQSLVSSASAAAISKSGNVAARSVRETLGASPSEAPMMGAAGPVSTSPEMGSRKTASSSVVTAGPPSQLKYPNFMAGSSEQDIGPNGEKVQSNAQSAAPVSVTDFAKSVADLRNAEVDRMNEGFDEDGNPIEAASLAGTEPTFSEVTMPADSGAEARILSLTRNRLRVHARSLFAAGLNKKAFDAAISAIGDDTGLQGKDWIVIAEAYTGGPVNGWAASGAVKAIKRAFAERVHDVSLAELGGFDPSVSGSNLDWREDARHKIERMAERLPDSVEVAIRDTILLAVGGRTLSSRHGLEIEGGLFSPQTAESHLGVKRTTAQKILAISLAYGPDAALQTFTHEEIHALKALSLFTAKEWPILEKLAVRKPKKSEALRLIDAAQTSNKITAQNAEFLRANAGDVTYREIYNIDDRYGRLNLSEDKLVEEVIAHAAADWADGHDFGTRIERLMMKIRDLLEALGNFLRGNGFESVDSIFNSVWSGEVAKRAEQEGGQEGPPIEGYPVVQTQAPVMASIPGQHASGTRFNKFSDEKVGTGIDAGRKDKTGLYGPGHYITTSPEKSDLYKQQFGPNGVVYDVEITRDPDEFLNWHQPLSAQGATGEKIADAIAARGFMTREEALNIRRGEEVLLALGSGQKEHYKAVAAAALKKMGVAGIAYTDTIDNFKSRHWDFVVFNGNDIRITHVNGEATPDTMDTYGMMFSLAGQQGGSGGGKIRAHHKTPAKDANTGDVLYSLPGEQGGDANLNNAIDTLKRSLGIQVSQNLFGVTIKAGSRSVRINPRSNILGQTSRTSGGIGVRRSRDIRAIAHEGGHSLEIMLGNKLNAIKAKYADSLVAPFAPDTPMPKLTAQGFSGLELDDVEQTALADAVRTQNLLMQWSTKVGNAKSAPRMIGKPQYDESAYRKVEADAGAARAQLVRLVGKTRADGLMDEVRAKAPQNATQFIQERFSPMGAPKRRTTAAPSGEALSEGFARWFEKYTMSRESAYDMAPQFFDAFEDLLEAEAPTVLEGIHTVQAQYKDWTKRASVEELSSDVVSVSSQNDWASIAEGKKSFAKTVTGWAADAYTGVIDDLSPIQMVVRRLLAVADKNGVTDADGKPLSLKVAENPYKIARMFRGSYATGYTWIKDGIPNHGEGRVTFPGLQAAMDQIFDRNTWDQATYKAFGQYLISKRALAEFDRLATKKKRLADIDSILKQGSAVWAKMTTEQAKDQATLDRRNTRHIQLDAIRRDRVSALKRAKSEEKDIQERMQDIRDDLAEAMRAIDDGSDAAKALRDRKRRSLQNAERNARDARNRVVDMEQELQDIDMEWTILGNEIVNLRKATENRQPQIDAIEQSVALMKKERERTANRGASRPPTLESQDWHQEFIAKVESNKKYAKFAEAAQIVYQFTQGLLTVRHQAGLIPEDLYRELSGRAGWYVPFMRDMSDAQPESIFTGNGGGKSWSPFKKFDGSDRAIINPLEILSQEAYAAAQHIAMNEAVGALASLAQKAGPGSANIAELMERTEDLDNTPETWSRIRDIAISMGIDEADATLMAQRMEMNFANADLQAIWSPGAKGPITKPTLPLWQKGERRHVMLNDPEFGHDALQAMMGLGKEEMNWILELFGKPARLLQVGVTTHPTFMPRNLVRDVFDAWVKTGALPIVTQVRGAKELYGEGEFLRQYTAAGGILGGRNIAALTSKEQQADLMELDPNKVRHGSAILAAAAVGITGTIMGGPLGGLAGSIIGYAGGRHGGLLKMVEAVESMTRLGVAAHAYKRALIHNPDLTEQEAMLEAAFVARDVFDWNRRGSKSLALVRTITFLNAQLQGLDRAARAMGGAGDRGSAIKKQLAAVFRREHDVPLSKDEERDLGDAYKTFARLALYTAFLLALYAMYRDDDRYEDIKDQTKATHSWLPGFLGVDVRLPKAFEWAMPANFIEVLWDKMEGRDPDIGDRWRKSMQQVLVPPGVPQGLNLLVGWTTNKDMQSIAPWMFGDSADKVNRTIVSDEMKKLAPEQQFDAYTSQLSKDIAVAMVKAGVPEGMIPSPKMVDFTIRTGGYWGSDLQKSYQMGKESMGYPAGPQPRVPDWPIVGGFTGVAARQSKSVEQLYNLMSQQGGEFTTAAATYKNMLDKAGDQAGAEAFLNRLEPEARAYAILAYNFTAADKRRHPLERASAVAKITRDIRKEIVLDRLAPQKKEGRKSVYDFESRIDLPPPVKTQVQDIMERLAQAESWNAFVALGRPGWEGKKEMATKPILDELKAAASDVYGLFKDREDKAKIEDFETVRKEWPKMRDELLRNGADAKI